ncbi:ATP-binding protein [Virgibacillus siamensis]|uniref:ATP-binding protein n=1 Tax=Virgibacillus siamensis TaxID=480071 RepID=UPI0009858A76|nr:sensor histidine kinase [Virgibacillus siamensis]
MMKVSMQTKILTLIISLILFVTLAFTCIIAYMEMEQTEKNMGQRALQVATTVSFMPSIIEAFEMKEPSKVIQPIAEKIRKKVGAEFIVVGNADSIRYSHPDAYKIGRHMVGGDNGKALINGEYYTSKAVGSLGPSLRGKAPILNDSGDIIGIVSVGFMINDVQSVILEKLIKVSGFALIIVFLGIVGGIMLSRNIRKDILGLEPYQIASLYRERQAILLSISEGIIAIDNQGKITMVNHSAQRILGLPEDCTGQQIEDVLPNTEMYHVLKTGNRDMNKEMIFRNRNVIVNRTPVVKDKEVVGVVSTFRDKTEVNEMLNTLSEVRRYSEDLRAQTHEFTNKLYVLSGLLQLGHYNEAIKLIHMESEFHSRQNKVLLGQIEDRTVQAILLGKMGKASEKKVDLVIDSDSSLQAVPSHIGMSQLIMVLGNLIDNAIDAVDTASSKQVTFFATDLGSDVVFEISDTGSGINIPGIYRIFQKGYSSKGSTDRGYGLSTVNEVVDELQGHVEVHNQTKGGAVFTVFLPKKLHKDKYA